MKKLSALILSLFVCVSAAVAAPDDGSVLVSSGQIEAQQAKVLVGLFSQIAAPFLPAANEEAVAAAGSIQGDAAALSATKILHQVTGADGTKGVKLPSVAVGNMHFILNTTAGVLKIYPSTGGTINGGSANASLSFTTGVLFHMCWPSATDTWICA
jgi:hypothetical protein